jgi:hypothetical protein
MDFKLVLEKLVAAFAEQNIRYALMGGFAMGLWGGSRSTVDVDFLILSDDMTKVNTIMTGLGYKRYHHTENVSQYASPLNVFGSVDFIHAFREASLEMLKRAAVKNVFSGTTKIKTLMPEDIIGLKLQSVFNNPAREKIDMADIEMLASLHEGNLDRKLLKKYFKIFQMEDLYKKIFQGGKK